MPIDKAKWPKCNTPAGVAIFPKLTTPDTKFKQEGEFTTKLRLPVSDATPLINIITAFRDEALAVEQQEKGGRKLKVADLPFRDAVNTSKDKDPEPVPGFVDFSFKRKASGVAKRTGKPWKATIDLFDAAGGRLRGVEIWGGSVIRVAFQIVPWYTPALGFGVKLDLRGVKVLQLVGPNGERSASEYGFGDEEEGYRAPNEVPADSGASEGSGGAAQTGAEF